MVRSSQDESLYISDVPVKYNLRNCTRLVMQCVHQLPLGAQLKQHLSEAHTEENPVLMGII